MIQTRNCLLCNKEINDFDLTTFFNHDMKICSDCYDKLSIIDKNFVVDGVKSYALFKYEGKMKEVILQIKMSNDLELARELLKPFINEYKIKYYGYTLISVPSNENKDVERGFNVVYEIFKSLELPFLRPFIKTSEYKQSDHSYYKRKQVADYIKLVDHLDKNKKYLLVDDIVTSKETLKACIKELRNHGISKLKCFVLIYNHRELVDVKGKKELRFK